MRRAVRAEQAAEERLAVSEALNAFIEDDLIAASLEDGLIDLDKGIDVLEAAEEKIEGRLAGHPEVEAGARLILARTYYGIGLAIADQNRFVGKIIASPSLTKCEFNVRRAYDLFEKHLDDPASDRRYIGSAQTLTRVLLITGEAERAREVVDRTFAVIGDRLDLSERNQKVLARTALEVAGELRDLDAMQTSHAHLLGWRHTDHELWDWVFTRTKTSPAPS